MYLVTQDVSKERFGTDVKLVGIYETEQMANDIVEQLQKPFYPNKEEAIQIIQLDLNKTYAEKDVTGNYIGGLTLARYFE